jgi:hypothetical protein
MLTGYSKQLYSQQYLFEEGENMKKQRHASRLEEHAPKVYWKILLVLIAGVILFLGIPLKGSNEVSPAKAQGPEPTPQVVSVGEPVTPGLSPPVRSLPTTQPRKAGVPAPEVNPRQPGGYVPDNTEGRLPERAPLPQVSASNSVRTPTTILSFDGIDVSAGSGIPPDTVGDVGPNHYVQMVNSAFAIYNKSGVKLAGPTNINTLWTDGTLCQTQNEGDPIVLYDRATDRWMMTQFNHINDSTPPFFQCIAISTSPDPMGTWCTYSFNTTSTTTFNDYGKFGVWPDGYYMGANEGGFTAYVFDRINMATCSTARPLQRVNVPGQNMMLPSDLDGPTAPPANSPNYFYTMKTGNILEIWAFTVDWNIPANSTFVKLPNLTSAGFIYDVCPANPTDDFSFDCIPQPGTTQTLDAIGEWPMFRFQYRNHGSHESLVGNFTVDMNGAAGTDQAGIHWFELRKVGAGNWTIHNEGNHAPDAAHRWMGSAAMDQDGNIAVGYSVSDGATIFPSIRYTTRLATDPAGTLGSEATLHAGTASQTSANRWGDYSAMTVDPSDDCTFWYTNEYLQSSAADWRTRIGSFKIPSCGATSLNVYLPIILKNSN